MRGVVTGEVKAVEIDTYNPERPVAQVFISSDPRYVDRLSGPVDLANTVKVGDEAAFLVNFTARDGKKGAWLSVWISEQLEADAAPLRAVDAL